MLIGLSSIKKLLTTKPRRKSGPRLGSGMPILIMLSTMQTIVQPAQPRLPLAAEELRGLAPEMKANEKSLLNIKIESEVWIERRTSLDDPCEPWERTPIYVSCTAWFSGPPELKARVDVHREVLEWQDGIAPYVERSYSLSFDGQYGREVNHTMRYDDKTLFIKEGKRMADSPMPSRLGWLGDCTGIHFSNHYSVSRRGWLFSQVVQMAGDDHDFASESEFEFSLEEREGGINCLRINSGTKRKNRNYHSYLLDPSRGFALLEAKSAYVVEDGSEKTISFLKVSHLRKVAAGIWWPVEASLERPSTDPKKPYERLIYRVSKVTANDPNFDENVYTVPFPRGYFVTDGVTGRKYRVGQQ